MRHFPCTDASRYGDEKGVGADGGCIAQGCVGAGGALLQFVEQVPEFIGHLAGGDGQSGGSWGRRRDFGVVETVAPVRGFFMDCL